MNAWMLATLALLAAFAIPIGAAWRGPAARRLAALQLATTIGTTMLVAMTFAFDQPALIDIALTLSLLSLPGTLLLASVMERWL